MKKVLIALLSIGLISCSMPILNNTSKYSDLDREYSQFKTEALTQSYLKKKMDKWLSDNKYSKNLVREIEYAKFKHPDTLKDIVALQPTMFNDIIGDTSVNQKRNESSFENYIEYIDPYPSTVTAIDATNITETGFTANWNSVTNATAYKLYIDANSPIDVGDVTAYDVTGLSANSSHTYKVQAVNASGTSSDSNVITALTSLPALPAPVALNATSFTATGFAANWNTVTGATGYKLYVDDMTTGQAVNKYIITISGQASTTYDVIGLTSTSPSNYIYYVKAVNANGDSLSSNTITISDLRFGLVAYYPFNGNANDESGHSHHGTVYGAVLASDKKGNTNKAYSFNISEIHIGAISEITSNINWTISYWMNTNVFQDYTNTMDFNYTPAGNNAGPRFELSASGFSFITGWNQNDFTGIVTPLDIFTIGRWCHVVAIRDGNTKILYVDNVEVGRQTTTLLAPSFDNFIIGHGWKNIANRYFKGRIDEIRVYNRALTSQEIDALYKE